MNAIRTTLVALTTVLLLTGCPKSSNVPQDAPQEAQDAQPALDTLQDSPEVSPALAPDAFQGDVPMTPQEDLYMPVYDDIVGC